jgi:N-acetylglutamate synthase/N-acetylornithine aminotransferase
MAKNGNGILGGKITLKEFFAAVGILGAIAFTVFTYMNDRDVRLDAVAIQIEELGTSTKEKTDSLGVANEKQDEEIQGIREGIGFIKGQLATLISQIDKMEQQNERLLRSFKRKRKQP